MADETYEVEIVDDTSHVIEDSPEVVTDGAEQTPEQKATAQAQAEQEAASGTEKLTPKQRRDKAKERINELTRKYRDEERERVKAEQKLESEREQFQHQTRTFQQQQFENARVVYSTLEDNKKLLEANLALARERGDYKTENQIQDRLTEAREKMGRLKGHFPGIEQEGTPAPATTQQPTQGQQWQPPGTQTPEKPAAAQGSQLPEAARTWVQNNSFLTARQDLHPTVEAVRMLLRNKGMDDTKPEFYVELTKRLKSEFPEDVASQLKADAPVEDNWDELLGGDDDGSDDDGDQPDAGQQARQEQQPAPRPAQTVGDGGRGAPAAARSVNGKRKVTLTRDQIAFADRMGISREAYAAQVARQETNTGYTVIGD